MKLRSALIGLAASAGLALASGGASAAMPNGIPNADQVGKPEQVRLVCNWRGVCWRTAPRFYGAYGWGPRRWGWGHPGWHRGWHRW